MYHITFINDSKKLKATIYIIYLAETVYTAMLAYDLVDLVLNPNYNGCFSSLIVPVCGGLRGLPSTSNPSMGLTHLKRHY